MDPKPSDPDPRVCPRVQPQTCPAPSPTPSTEAPRQEGVWRTCTSRALWSAFWRHHCPGDLRLTSCVRTAGWHASASGPLVRAARARVREKGHGWLGTWLRGSAPGVCLRPGGALTQVRALAPGPGPPGFQEAAWRRSLPCRLDSAAGVSLATSGRASLPALAQPPIDLEAWAFRSLPALCCWPGGLGCCLAPSHSQGGLEVASW